MRGLAPCRLIPWLKCHSVSIKEPKKSHENYKMLRTAFQKDQQGLQGLSRGPTDSDVSVLLTQPCGQCVDASGNIFLSVNKFLISCSIMKDNRKVLQF